MGKDPCISFLFLLLPVPDPCHPCKSVLGLCFRKQTAPQIKRDNALKSNHMLSDLEYSYSPVRDKVRDLREYL